MAGLQYRQLQGPAELNTNIGNSGASQAYEELASTFKKFGDTATDIGGAVRAQQGEEAGRAAGAAGDLSKLGGWKQYTAYGKAYENAAVRSYTIKAEADAEDSAARLQVEAGTNVNTFTTTFGAVRDATIKQAPPEARGVLMDVYNQHMGRGVAAINAARAMELRTNARTDLSEGTARLTEQAGNLLGQDDPASRQQAEEAQVKLGMLIDGAQKDGTITDTEAAALHVDAQHKITQQTVVSRFQRELDNPMGDPVGFINRLHEFNKTDNALLPAEKEKLENTLYANLARKNELERAGLEMTRAATEARYMAGDKDATAALLNDTLTEPKLLEMVLGQNLKPEVARTLRNALREGDPGVDDSREVMNVETDLLHYTAEQIRDDSKLKFSTRTRLIDKLNAQLSDWPSKPEAKEADARIDRALGIVPGTIMATLSTEDATKRYQAKTAWYNAMSALDPATRQQQAIPVAEAVISQYIRRSAGDKAKTLRKLKAAYIESNPADSMSTKRKAEYDSQLANYDAQIRDAEAQAARQ